ncbi:CARDB domain-containing protein [Thermoproteota archaeon]
MEITPSSLKPGDVITINLQSKPNNKVNVTISKNRAINVTNNEFTLILERFDIPQNIENIQIEVKNVELLIATVIINEIPTTQTVQGKDGYAKIVQDLFPPGVYWVQLSGYSTTSVEQVYVNVSAQLNIITDEKGKATTIYDTTGLPPGEIYVKAGEYTKTVLIRAPYVPRLGNIVITPHNISERFQLNNEYELLYNITNQGDNATGFLIQLEIDEKITLQETILQLEANETYLYTVRWTPSKSGSHLIQVIIDPKNEIQETNEEDNIIQHEIDIEKTRTPYFIYIIAVVVAVFVYISLVVYEFSRK